MGNHFRAQFQMREGIYLLSHSVGRPPCSTRAAIESAFLDPWEAPDDQAWPRWLTGIEEFRKALATLLGAESGALCPQANLSSGLSKILLSRPVSPSRPVILCTDQDFPSMVYVLRQMQRFGYQLRVVRNLGDTLFDPDTWSAMLTPDVGVLLVGHVHSNTGRRMPVAEVTALTRERGITSVVDIAQSAGCIPIDLRRWHADFVLGSCVKWLCGGPGAAFLWGAPEAISASEPADVGWFSHAEPFEFDIDRFRYAPDALRFWGGTPSVTPYVVAANSIRTLLDIGLDTIRHHNEVLCAMLQAALPEAELAAPADPSQRGGTLVVKPAAGRLDEVLARLAAHQVSHDQRDTGLRLSPHIYNTEAEMGVVAQCLKG